MRRAKSKELRAVISEYHSGLTRDANLRFAFTRFFTLVYAQLDVAVFNALLRGPVSCGVGIVLKALLTELNMWAKAVNLPPSVPDALVCLFPFLMFRSRSVGKELPFIIFILVSLTSTFLSYCHYYYYYCCTVA